ncbi:MAG TPA: tail fiber domain-containing protein [Candidatus Dormibacteraeota bacterium]|nr:tail fiber domain-containing protein [Candidatus Dormibacteraeota bacterium]
MLNLSKSIQLHPRLGGGGSDLFPLRNQSGHLLLNKLFLLTTVVIIGASAGLIADRFITYPGERGQTGTAGINGANGIDGQDGTIGLAGEIGPQGLQGAIGDQGPEGPSGSIGDSQLSSNVALLDRNSQTFTGNNQLFRNNTDSTTAFGVQNTAGGTILNVDTSNGYVGIGTATPSRNLHVMGSLGVGAGLITDGFVNFFGTLSNTAPGATAGVHSSIMVNPASSSSTEFRSFVMSAEVPTTNTQTLTGNVMGGHFETRWQGSGSATSLIGGRLATWIPGAGQSFGTITNTYGAQVQGLAEFAATAITGTVTRATGLLVQNSSSNNNLLQNSVGIDVAGQTAGIISDIGVRIAKADTYTLQLSDTGGTAAGGITFGTDTNLYRQGVGVLQTDGSLRSLRASASDLAYLSAVTSDSINRFAIRADGSMEWGPGGASVRDTSLYRSTSAGLPVLRTDQTGGFIVGGTGVTGGRIGSINQTTAGNSFTTFVSGETQNRFVINATGKHDWSDGTNVADTNLYRGAANELRTDDDLRVGTGTTGCVKDADATVIAGSCSSDERLKKNITNVSDILSSFGQLKVVNYDWRSDEFPEYNFGTATQTGLIAQDVELLFPSLVSTDSNGYKTLDYTGLGILNIKATTELDAKTKGLEQRIATLEQVQGQGSDFANLNVSGTATINNLVVTGTATFEGGITIAGHIKGNEDTRGEVVIPAGQTSVHKAFLKPYSTKPFIVASPVGTPIIYSIESDKIGFTIKIAEPDTIERVFYYMVQE